MPPKSKITKEMIIEAGFEIAKSEGAENVNARTVSNKLGCSTQPVMYHFKRIDDLKRAVYQRADEYHTEYLMNFQSNNPMMDIGLNYIRFGEAEKNLFCLLFQSNEFSGKNIAELFSSEDIQPILQVLSQEAEVDAAQAKTIFTTLALFVHGYASMLANNSIEYNEESIAEDLERLFIGAVYASKEETLKENEKS